ncbi:3-oxoadipate enol-lactonase I3 [Beauveria bassiana ARSEF 2860]|uniref:3-oxoadipate enol-lactonase I3 n=1 Tax=Beauveria bassiana (strain ARSEF 2860) TaxID=655819 RepID=J4VZ69_BEAB2|nr:3-oxoadipate enol-lactonase I3 [Beauveria bassiana ARSEF 2860]EJP63610.1 3-oxoadipate enol-lactonase I3 [Beauveria bassiana ARSEF 2860]
MASPGLLYVTMQPRPGLPIAQFHEWYNNEHGPTRLSIPSIFANGFRYQSTSPTTTTTTSSPSSPAFLAVYDIHHMPLLATPTYTTLRANRSPREAATIAQVDVRRAFYDLLHTAAAPDFQPIESLSDRDAVGLVTVAVEIALTSDPAAGDEYQNWYVDEHVGMLAKVPGWRRSRLFKTSSLLQEGNDETATTYLCLHDYAPDNGLGGAEHKASMDTPRRTAVFEKYVARKSRQTYSLFYVFGPASRDLYSLSQLDPPSSASFTSPSGTLQTSANSITSRITTAPSGLVIRYRLQGNPSPSAPVVVFSNSLLTSYAIAANTQAWRDRIDVARGGGGGGGIAALAGQTVARWFHPETKDETVAWMTDMVAENDVEGFAHSCTALWDYDLKEQLPGCAVPGLLVAGEADGKGALVKAMESFKGLVGEEGAALHVVPRAGHLPMCEYPQGFWDAIKDFI